MVKDKTLKIRIDCEDYEKLQAYADLKKVSMAHILREYIRRLPNPIDPVRRIPRPASEAGECAAVECSKMNKGKLNITPEQMAVYRATAKARHQSELQELALRQQYGWEVARQGARLLKQQFGAKRVVLFGSLLDLKRMHQRSDVDLAVWGLDERHYFRAVADLLDIDPTFCVDLVEAEHARPHILKAINTTGVEV